MARWLNMFETTCANPSRESECLEWFENHIARVLETPGYVSGGLYRMKEFRNGRGQFLTMYEIDTDDIGKTMALRREKQKTEVKRESRYDVDTLMIPLWKDVLWREIASVASQKARRKKEKWINLVEINCADPLREKEFNEWYSEMHLADTLETPGFLAARRYERERFVGGRAKYLAVYEIDTDDIDSTVALRRENREKEKERGRYRVSDLFLRVWQDVLWQVILERRAGT